jgi:hypothetical protein
MSIKSRSAKGAYKKIAQKTGSTVAVVKKAIEDALKHGNLNGEFKFLTFAGLLPVFLPDGTKIAVFPDIHVPAHHKGIMWAVKRALKDFQPDILVFIGDLADLFAASAWPADPSVARNFQQELDESRELADELMEVSGAYWAFWIMGNHEDRMWRLLTNVVPQLANIINPTTREKAMAIHDLLGYGPNDPVTFLYDLSERGGFGGGIVVNNDVEYHHGYIVRPKPAASPRADSDRTGRSTTHGHTHRMGMTVRETTHGEVVAVELGHLVDPRHPYLAYANLLNNWHPGIAFDTIVDGKVRSEPLPIDQVEIDGQLRFVLSWNEKDYLSSDR